MIYVNKFGILKIADEFDELNYLSSEIPEETINILDSWGSNRI